MFVLILVFLTSKTQRLISIYPCYFYVIMEYLSQVDNVVEVLAFLLSKIQFAQDVDDLDLVKKLSNLNSVVGDFRSRTLPIEEEGELVGFTKTETFNSLNENILEDKDDALVISSLEETFNTLKEHILEEQENENVVQEQDDSLETYNSLKENFLSYRENENITAEQDDSHESVDTEESLEETIIEGQESGKENRKVEQDKSNKSELDDKLLLIDTRKNEDKTTRLEDCLNCSECGKGFQLKRAFKKHQLYHKEKQKEVKLKCSECGEGFKSEITMKAHLKRHWKKYGKVRLLTEKILNDFHQNQVSIGSYDPKLLKRCRENIFLFSCAFCKINFISRSEYESHNFENHISEDQRWRCPSQGCGFEDDSMIRVMDHFADEQNGIVKTLHVNHGSRLKYCPECDQAFYYFKHLRQHLIQAHGIKKGSHTCLMCYQEFDTKSRTWLHMRHIHDNSHYICYERIKIGKNCYKRFSTRKLYQDHVRDNHPVSPPKRSCEVCGMEFLKHSGTTYLAHIETHGNLADLRFKCSECGKGFSFEKKLKRHQQICGFKDNDARDGKNDSVKMEKIKIKGPKDCLLFHCCLCCHNFKTKEEQLEHDKEKHLKNDNFTCPDCDFSSLRKMTMLEHFAEKHRRDHTFGFGGCNYGVNLVTCQECDQAFFSDRLLRTHLNQAHGHNLRLKECIFCFKLFPTQRQAKVHQNNDHVGYKFKCVRQLGRGKDKGGTNKCGILFDTQGELDDHVTARHLRMDKYTCDVCGKGFRKLERAKFNRHVDSHSMGKPVFNCDQCDKSFFFETELASHKKYHHTVHKCDQCDFTSWNPVKVREHLITKHTDPDFNPHVCSNCGKGFKLKMNLTRHMETHDTVKKHECKVCGKKFSANRHLYTHSKIHSKSYEAECNICNRKFVQKYNWRLHMRKQHPEVSDETTDKKCKKEI